MNNQKIKSLTTLAAGAIVLVGCSAGTPATTSAPAVTASGAPAATTAPAETQASTAPASSTAPAGAQDADAHNESAHAAIKAAEAAVTGRAVALDHDGDADENWEVDVVAGDKGHEIEVDRAGKVVKNEADDTLDADDKAKLDKATVTLPQAIDKALQATPGKLDDAELDDENGTVVWEVTIDTAEKDDIDVYVDAASGEVVKKG